MKEKKKKTNNLSQQVCLLDILAGVFCMYLCTLISSPGFRPLKVRCTRVSLDWTLEAMSFVTLGMETSKLLVNKLLVLLHDTFFSEWLLNFSQSWVLTQFPPWTGQPQNISVSSNFFFYMEDTGYFCCYFKPFLGMHPFAVWWQETGTLA